MKIPSGRRKQQPGKIGFAQAQWQLAQVFTVEREAIERVRLNLGIMLTGMQATEIGHPVEGFPMNYQAFTNDSLTMMYEGVRGALASDDALSRLGEEPRFRVRETPDWKKHAGELESEMLNRGMFFDVIDWSEDQTPSPF
jgi:hypothetical protein